MTQDEIIEMAKQANAGMLHGGGYSLFGTDAIERFANLVAQHEREEIVQFIERTNLASLPDETALHYAQLLKSYSTAIRARGQA
jgi:hypothetical protein